MSVLNKIQSLMDNLRKEQSKVTVLEEQRKDIYEDIKAMGAEVDNIDDELDDIMARINTAEKKRDKHVRNVEELLHKYESRQ